MNSKYRIGFLCAGAAFFLFITLAYKMTYDYTMDKYMEKVSERNEDVQRQTASEKQKVLRPKERQ